MKDLITPSKIEVVSSGDHVLDRAEFQMLAEVPPESEWFGNIKNLNTKRAYIKDVREFFHFLDLRSDKDLARLREVKRAHVIAWRSVLEIRDPKLASATIRRKLSAVSSLFKFLCEEQAVNDNPVRGVERPNEEANQGKTPPLGAAQTQKLLEEPDTSTLLGKRDAALLSLMFYSAPRREEVSNLTSDAMQTNQGIPSLRVKGKGDKTRWVELAPDTIIKLKVYLKAASLPEDSKTPLFQPVKRRSDLPASRKLHPNTIYSIIKKYARKSGLDAEVNIHPHTARSTATTNALSNGADLHRTMKWLGHANVQTTTLYDHRDAEPQDSPSFRVSYGTTKKKAE